MRASRWVDSYMSINQMAVYKSIFCLAACHIAMFAPMSLAVHREMSLAVHCAMILAMCLAKSIAMIPIEILINIFANAMVDIMFALPMCWLHGVVVVPAWLVWLAFLSMAVCFALQVSVWPCIVYAMFQKLVDAPHWYGFGHLWLD